MIRFVSASSERCFNSTGSPTLIRTTGGSVRLSTFGSRAERGHTFSVPHSPTGMTGAPLSWARRAAPQRPFSSRIEERRAAWDRALRHQRHHLAAEQRVGRRLERLVGSGARSTRMPPIAAASWPTIGDVEHLLLAEEAHGAAGLGDQHRDRQRIEVASGGWRRGSPSLPPGTFSTPVELEAGVRHERRSGELHRQPLQLEADERDLHHSW